MEVLLKRNNHIVCTIKKLLPVDNENKPTETLKKFIFTQITGQAHTL